MSIDVILNSGQTQFHNNYLYTGGETVTVDLVTANNWILANIAKLTTTVILEAPSVPAFNASLTPGVAAVGLVGGSLEAANPQGVITIFGGDLGMVSGNITAAQAAQNQANLQAACNLGESFSITTPGIYYLSATTIQPEGCVICLGANVVLIAYGASGANAFPLFINAIFDPTIHVVSGITSAQITQQTGLRNVRCTAVLDNTTDIAASLALGKTYVIIDGDATLAYIGGYEVETVSGNNVTFIIPLTGAIPGPAVAAAAGVANVAGNITMRLANNVVGIIGQGKLDGNFLKGNFTKNNTYFDHIVCYNNIINPGIGGGYASSLQVEDGCGYAVCIQNTVNPKAVGIHMHYGSQDFVHIYGPCFGSPIVEKLTGQTADDGCVGQTIDGSAYLGYMLPTNSNDTLKGGNFYRPFIARDINLLSNGNSGQVCMYPNSDSTATGTARTYHMAGVIAENVGVGYPNVNGNNAGAAVVIGNGYALGTTPTIEDIFLKNIKGQINISNASAGATSPIYNSKIIIEKWKNNNVAYPAESILIDVINKQTIIDGVTLYNGGAVTTGIYLGSLVAGATSYGNMRSVTVKNAVVEGSGSGAVALIGCGATLTNTRNATRVINFENITLNGNSQLAAFNSAFSSIIPTVKLKAIDGSTCANNVLSLGSGTQNFNIDTDGVYANTSAGYTPFAFYGPTVNISIKDCIAPNSGYLFASSAGISTTILAAPDYINGNIWSRQTGTAISVSERRGGNRILVATPAASVVTLTYATTPMNGERLEISVINAQTSLTLSGIVLPGITSGGAVLAGFNGRWIYSTSDSAWIAV